MRRVLLAALLLLPLAGTALAQSTTDLSKAPSGIIPMETKHTVVSFSVIHVGPVEYWSHFEDVDGSIDFNPAAPEKSSVSVTIGTGSVYYRFPSLVEELKAADAFNVAKFPKATFKSTAITRTGPTSGTMTGDFTFKGVTHPITFDVTFLGSMPNGLGFHATATIKRSQYDMDKMRFTKNISDDVKIMVDALFQKQRPAAAAAPAP